ncbi:MAG TPA: serine hydrolase domain-containing protein [Rectinemataceae bacterium]|nr:serine hydrolase domain-containing protein [Rectinemataceae bacterium]
MSNVTEFPPRASRKGRDSLDALIDEALLDRTFPGIACGIWIDGHPEYLRCVGFADPALAYPDSAGSAKAGPIAMDTLFDAASLTKPLATSLLVMKAREAGAIDIDKTAGHYLPGLQPLTAGIPLHRLLTHTSGLPAIPAIERRFPSPSSLDRDDAISELCAIRPERSCGEAVVYSCAGYMILGLILERVSGKLLGDLYRTEIAEPLGLPKATFAPGIGRDGAPLFVEGAAATEFCAWRKRRMRGQVHDESAYCLGGHSGNAGLFASLEDIFLTASMLIQEGSAGGRRFLSEKSIADLKTEKTAGLGERRSFGFRLHETGTFEGPLWGPSSFGHTGFTGTSLAIAPEQKMLAIVLTNRVYYGRNETMQKMADFRVAFHSRAFENFA